MFFLSNVMIFATLVLLFLLSVNFLRNREFYKLASQFPGPFSLPIVGNFYLFLGDNEQIYKSLLDLYEKFPECLRIWLGGILVIFFYNPEEIKSISNSPNTIEKDDSYVMLKSWLGSGLLTAPGDIWKVHRKLIQPTFNQRILLTFVEIFQKHASKVTKRLEKEVDCKEFKVFPYLLKNSLGAIRESVMGVNDLEDENAYDKYLVAIKKTLEIVNKRLFKIWLRPDIIFKFTKLSKQSEKYINYLHNSTDNIIRSKREKLNTGVAENDNSKKMIPFLDLLMKLSDDEKSLTDLQLRNEVDTFLFAGHDATAKTISFVFLMLASHPDIQDKVYKEIYELFGSKSLEEVPFKSEHLQHFVYLEKVIKETMRLFPVAPIISRKTVDNLKIEKYTVPKGSVIVVPISKIHRDGKIWPNPLIFNPERFSPEEVAKRHPYSYLPFGIGPRNCIGQVYAMMSMKCTITSILRKYILKKDQIMRIEDIRLKLDTVIQTVKPITIRIEKRIKD